MDVSTCPECGALIRSENAIEGSDVAIYPELSRANLLRMRGEYSAAEEQCLSILKRYPNNVTVHTLLGDIHAEQGNLETAAQWYELAADLDPQSTTIQQKLRVVEERYRQKEAADSVQSLGLSDGRNNIPLFATVSVVVVFLVGLIAFFIGQGMQERPRNSVVEMPISASDQGTEPTTGGTAAQATTGGLQRLPQADLDLQSLVTQRSTVGGNLIALQIDPRNRIVTVTYQVGSNDDEKRIGAELARTVLEQNSEVAIVTLRAVRDDSIAYMADVPRSRYNDLQSGAYNTTPDAWIQHIVTNEWPSVVQPSSSAPAPVPPTGENSTPPATTPPPAADGDTTGPEFLPPLNR